MKFRTGKTAMAAIVALLIAIAPEITATAQETGGASKANDTYSKDEILTKAGGFFGATTKGLAQGIEKVFSDLGQPNGYITGEEFGGAFFVGLRYGRGQLNQKSVAPRDVFWQGPSVGFDFGGNASKVFTLVYDLKRPGDLYRRFPGVDGSLYVIAGVSLNYQRAGDVTLAPIRTGVGLRAGANIGYLHYNREHSWLPF
tara:strand:+ start:1040 stop:1636 length:597 start_codon:yes stop_codon:yes gene_type:complete